MADKFIRTFVVMSFFLVLALFSGCGTNGTSLTDADNGNQIRLQPGHTLSVTLESNPTTGYGWQVMELDQAVLAQDGSPEYKQSAGSDGVVGAGGTDTFRFNAVGPGETSLRLGYMRPWESAAPIKNFEIQVKVEE